MSYQKKVNLFIWNVAFVEFHISMYGELAKRKTFVQTSYKDVWQLVKVHGLGQNITLVNNSVYGESSEFEF